LLHNNIDRFRRCLVLLFMLLIPVAFDNSVAESSGDARWYLLHWTALILTAGYLFQEKEKGPLRIPAIALIIFFLLALAAESMAWSVNLYKSWWSLKHATGYAALFWFVYVLRGGLWWRALLWMVAWGAGFNAALGIAQANGIVLFGNYFEQASVPAGTLANKNLLGSYLVVTLPAVLYLMISSRRWIARISAGAVLIAGVTALLYVHSIASWIAVLCAGFFLMAWSFRSKRVVVAEVICMAVVCVALVGTKKMQQSETRLAYNINGLAIVKDHPQGGVGLGAFKTIYGFYRNAIIDTPAGGFSKTTQPSRIHNDLMQAFVELGIAGGLTYIAIFVVLIAMAWRVGTAMSMCLISGVIGLGINSLMDFPLQLPMAPIALSVFAGIITGLYVDKMGARLWNIPRYIYALLAMLAVVGGLFIFQDDWNRRVGSQCLRASMSLCLDGDKERALANLEQSFDYYPWNSRLYEYAVISK